MKMIIAVVFFILFIAVATKYTGVSDSKVPQGKEVKDAYLEKLFEPEFPYESIKIIVTNKGKRYVIIKAKDTVTVKIRTNYPKKHIV